jgi:hypothetical protein
MSERYSSTRDVTSTLRIATPTGPHLIQYMCREPNNGPHHKGLRLGGEWQGKLPMRCPMCVHAKGQKQ